MEIIALNRTDKNAFVELIEKAFRNDPQFVKLFSANPDSKQKKQQGRKEGTSEIK